MHRPLQPNLRRLLMRICSPWAVACIGGLCIGFAISRVDQPRGLGTPEDLAPRAATFDGMTENVRAAATDLDFSIEPLPSEIGELSAPATLSPGRAAQSEDELSVENGAKPELSENASR